jgi:hypothetical protein
MTSTYRLTVAVAAMVAFTVAHAAAPDASSTPATDPVPRATKAQQQKKARFAEQQATLQDQSRSSASGSPRVNKASAAPDPTRKPATKAEKKARFADQEKQLQGESRP